MAMCEKGKGETGKKGKDEMLQSPFSSLHSEAGLGLFCNFHPAKTLINSSECNSLAGKRLRGVERVRIPLDSGVGEGELRNTHRRKLSVGKTLRRHERAEKSFSAGETCLEKRTNCRQRPVGRQSSEERIAKHGWPQSV